MKIAVVSDDGVTVSQHFGRAELYVVLQIEDGAVVGRENRPRSGHRAFASMEQHTSHGGRHGYDEHSQSKHHSMAQAIADCQVLIAGGMGWGAYESMKGYNIEPIVTDVGDIEQAVALYLEGRLENLMERVH